MDAFKELAVKNPNTEVAPLEELHGYIFWSGVMINVIKKKMKEANNKGLQEQSNILLKEGQQIAENQFYARQELGRRAKNEPKINAPVKRIGGTLSQRYPSGEPPKWKRLGFQSEKDMKNAEFLTNHPQEATEVIEESKIDDDFPSFGAVKSKVRAKRAEARAEKAEAYAQDKKEKELKKEVRERKEYKAYLEATKTFKHELELAITYAKQGLFAPESRGWIVKRHEEINKYMTKLEDLL